MPNIEWNAVATWLKTTIPGIVFLGALGSILAFYVLKLFSSLGKRLFNALLDKFMTSNFRPFTRSALLAFRYINEGRWIQLTIYAIFIYVSFAISFIVFFIALVGTMVVAVHFGVTAPGLLTTLVAFTGLTFIMLLRDIAAFAGVYLVLFHADISQLNQLLKDQEFFKQATAQIFETLRNPPQHQNPPARGAPVPPPAPPAPAEPTPGGRQPPPNQGAA